MLLFVFLAQAGVSICSTRRGGHDIGTGLSTNGFTCLMMAIVNTSGSTLCVGGSSSSWPGVVMTVAGSLTQTCPTGGRIDKLMETSTGILLPVDHNGPQLMFAVGGDTRRYSAPFGVERTSNTLEH